MISLPEWVDVITGIINWVSHKTSRVIVELMFKPSNAQTMKDFYVLFRREWLASIFLVLQESRDYVIWTCFCDVGSSNFNCIFIIG